MRRLPSPRDTGLLLVAGVSLLAVLAARSPAQSLITQPGAAPQVSPPDATAASSSSEAPTAVPPSHEGTAPPVTAKAQPPLGVVFEREKEDLSVKVRYQVPGSTTKAELTVTFEDEETYNDYPMDSVVVVDPAAGTIKPAAQPVRGWLGGVNRLTARTPLPMLLPGDAVPDVELVNHEGQPLRLSAFRGVPVLILFVHARSSVGASRTFNKRAEQLQKQLVRSKKAGHIISVSFDPQHDTPDVLKGLAERYDADGTHWQLTTGKPEDIERLADALGFVAFGIDGTFSYTLTGAIVKPDGTLDGYITGDNWQASDILERFSELSGQ